MSDDGARLSDQLAGQIDTYATTSPHGFPVSEITAARCALVGSAYSATQYCRANGVDWRETEPATGGIFLAKIVIEAAGRFDFARRNDQEAVEAVVLEAVGADGETVEDIIAWPVTDPGCVLTACGRAAVLGEAWAANPASYIFGAPLRLFRTPLQWLQAGCRGAVILRPDRAARWLIENVDADLAVDDDVAGDELQAVLIRVSMVNRILIRRLVEVAQ